MVTKCSSLSAEQPVDVIVLDITMPGRNGLETLKELRRSHSKIGVIILSMHPKDQYAVRVLRAGAAAYITKESAPEELVLAIRKAYRGEKYISPDVAELLADFVEKGPPEEPHKLLSDREFEVLRLIASGSGISQIAEQLQLSVKTVSTYRTGSSKRRASARIPISHATRSSTNWCRSSSHF